MDMSFSLLGLSFPKWQLKEATGLPGTKPYPKKNLKRELPPVVPKDRLRGASPPGGQYWLWELLRSGNWDSTELL